MLSLYFSQTIMKIFCLRFSPAVSLLTQNRSDKEEITDYLVKTLQMEQEQAQIAAGFCQGNMGKAIRFATSKDFQEMKDETLHLLKNIEQWIFQSRLWIP